MIREDFLFVLQTYLLKQSRPLTRDIDVCVLACALDKSCFDGKCFADVGTMVENFTRWVDERNTPGVVKPDWVKFSP